MAFPAWWLPPPPPPPPPRPRDLGRATRTPRIEHASHSELSRGRSTRGVAELPRRPGVRLLRARPAIPQRPLPLDRHLRPRPRVRRRIRFFESVRLFKRLVNVGDVKSPVAHPASTTPLTASCRAKR